MAADRPDTTPITRRRLIGAAWSAPLVAVNLPTSAHRENGRSAISDVEFPSLEVALGATPVGGVLEVRKVHRRAVPFVVDKAVTVRFLEQGAVIVSSSSVPALVIASSDVTLDGPVLKGPDGNTADDGDGIRAVGTADDPLTGIHIWRPRVQEFAKHGILLEHVRDFHVADLDIRRCGYAGVMLLSVVNGSVSRGLVKDILQPDGYVNSYGLAVSRRSTGSITSSAPRSRDVVVEQLTVDGVRAWEGLDTHAGQNITFRSNAVYNTRTGIAVVGSKGERGERTAYAPLNCHVIDNALESGVEDGTAARGIVFAGAADSLGSPRELATGRVIGNLVRDYGAHDSPSGTSIHLYGTAGVTVADNTMIHSGSSGINFDHDNYGASAASNTIIDVWSNGSAPCSAVYLRSSHNKVTISGTTIVRMAKKARKVNDRGLTIAATPTNVVLDGGGNDWAEAVRYATVGDASTTESRNYAKKTGFYGVPPVPQATAIPSPAADPVELKIAVDALRETLTNLGLSQ